MTGSPLPLVTNSRRKQVKHICRGIYVEKAKHTLFAYNTVKMDENNELNPLWKWWISIVSHPWSPTFILLSCQGPPDSSLMLLFTAVQCLRLRFSLFLWSCVLVLYVFILPWVVTQSQSIFCMSFCLEFIPSFMCCLNVFSRSPVFWFALDFGPCALFV